MRGPAAPDVTSVTVWQIIKDAACHRAACAGVCDDQGFGARRGKLDHVALLTEDERQRLGLEWVVLHNNYPARGGCRIMYVAHRALSNPYRMSAASNLPVPITFPGNTQEASAFSIRTTTTRGS